MRRPRVEILYFEGWPNHEPARVLVERLARQLGIEPEILLLEVANPDAAVALRFLGSPTVRVDGVDVEPGAEERRLPVTTSDGRLVGLLLREDAERALRTIVKET